MSKKLIAVASAAALALSALVAAPASAAALAVTITGGLDANTGTTSAQTVSINVPSQDVLRWNASTDGTAANTASLVRLQITATTTSDAVRVTSTGGVKLITQAQYSDSTKRKTATGVQALDLTSDATDGFVYVYAFNTSTTAGTVVVTSGGSTLTRYIKGKNTGYGYNIAFTAPSTANVSDSITFTGTITDAFGNPVTGSADVLTETFFGAASALSADTTLDWAESDTIPGTYTFDVDTTATAGSGIVGLALTSAPVKITAFGTPKGSTFVSFTTASLADQVTALTASVAALKADYNALAAKYNKLVKKSKRVALK
jgi:hypothetical protein